MADADFVTFWRTVEAVSVAVVVVVVVVVVLLLLLPLLAAAMVLQAQSAFTHLRRRCGWGTSGEGLGLPKSLSTAPGGPTSTTCLRRVRLHHQCRTVRHQGARRKGVGTARWVS